RDVELRSFLLWPFERLKDGQHAVVVLLRERLELVVVAAGAAEREAEERGRRCSQHVIELVVAIDLRIGRLIIPSTQAKEGRGDLRLGVATVHFVAGKLFGNEAIKRLILIEGVNDIIAVAPGAWLGPVALVTVRFGIAGYIEPVQGPALA